MSQKPSSNSADQARKIKTALEKLDYKVEGTSLKDANAGYNEIKLTVQNPTGAVSISIKPGDWHVNFKFALQGIPQGPDYEKKVVELIQEILPPKKEG